MAANVKTNGNDVFIGTKKYTRKLVNKDRHKAVSESLKASYSMPKASAIPDVHYNKGVGTYVEVHAAAPGLGRVVCNVLYDGAKKPAGYIRISAERQLRSDSSLRNIDNSFYCLNTSNEIVTFR